MTLEALTTYLDVWVTQYLAVACLLSILLWTGVMYLKGQFWEKTVRDAALFLVSIGTLTLMLALRPTQTDAVFWNPLNWFCFTMLLMMELLWVSYLVDTAYQFARGMSMRGHAPVPPVHPSLRRL